MRNRFWLLLTFSLLAVLLPSPGATALAKSFPQIISLPDGFRPEGLAIGQGTSMYTGSLATGAIYRADLQTGAGSILVAPQTGRAALGLDVDERTNYLYVAGGPTGHAYIYDAATGATLRDIQLTTASPTFINAVVVTRDAAYFTDSFQPVFYRLQLLPDGKLPSTISVRTIPLGGDFEFVSGGQFNSNGIVTSPDGKSLIIVHTALGKLYRVDPSSGNATEINLHGGSVPNGDGLLRIGDTLYVVQNTNNLIAVVQLEERATAGRITRTITDPNFDVPTSIDNLGEWLYVVNARFATTPTPQTTYTVVRVRGAHDD